MAYYFVFHTALPESGISECIIRLNLRNDGSLYEKIPFPEISTQSTNGWFVVPMSIAYETARNAGFLFSEFRTHLEYDEKSDELKWRFSSWFVMTKGLDGQVMPYEYIEKICDVSALTGEILFSGERHYMRVADDVFREVEAIPSEKGHRGRERIRE